MSEIRSLEKLSLRDAKTFGGKAAHLGELIQFGIRVPPGFCISHQMLSSIMQINGEPVDKINASLRRNLAKALAPHLKAMRKRASDEPLLAIRSSASGEDSAGASFAGQFDSVLGVRTINEVCDAIVLCWRSNSSGRAVSYTRRRKLDAVSMSVIVQQLVVPNTAGVCFTCHPVTLDKEVLVVEANWGFCDTVVSGTVSPDHFEINSLTRKVTSTHVACKRRMSSLVSGKIAVIPVPENQQCESCLSNDDIVKLTDTALLIQSHFKCPQDIEWAINAHGLFIVQSRPITAIKESRSTKGGMVYA